MPARRDLRTAASTLFRQMLVSARQQTPEALGPLLLPVLVRDQILANFDERVRQAMALAVDRRGVVGAVADKIRLVVADDEGVLLPQ